MSKTNSEETKEKVEVVAEKAVITKPGATVEKLSADTQRMNARQFFDTYPHDNIQVVDLIVSLYGNQIKTVAQWEAFYQQMLKKKVS